MRSAMDSAGLAKLDIEERKDLLGLTEQHETLLTRWLPHVEQFVDEVIDQFFALQMDIPVICKIIEDNESLANLKRVTRSYVISFFTGIYDQAYVTSRLRIGRIHAAVGVPVKLYVSSLHQLETLLSTRLRSLGACQSLQDGLHKLFMMDIQFALDTFINGVVHQVLDSHPTRPGLDEMLEITVAERTAEIERIAQTDHLTGLWNRRAFVHRLKDALAVVETTGTHLSLVFIDLDDFKQVNDAHGHQEGDRILEVIGRGLLHHLRTKDMAFRYGGDEFCVLMPATDKDVAETVISMTARRVCETIKATVGYRVGYSVGIATSGPDHYLDPRALLAAADRAMYDEKGATGTQWHTGF